MANVVCKTKPYIYLFLCLILGCSIPYLSPMTEVEIGKEGVHVVRSIVHVPMIRLAAAVMRRVDDLHTNKQEPQLLAIEKNNK